MKNAERKLVLIRYLQINPENPRYPETKITEEEAIRELLEIVEPKRIYNLTAHIVEYGLNPSFLPIIYPKPNKTDEYDVLDGNRRLMALKFLRGDFNVDDYLSKYWADQFRHLQSKFYDKYKDVQSILCYIPTSREEGMEWVRLHHTGENDGAGTVRWSTRSKDQLRQQKGGSVVGLKVVNYLKKKGLVTEKQADATVLSSVERIVKSDPDAAELIGISVKNDALEFTEDESTVAPILARLVLDTVEKDPITQKKILTSRTTNDKDERINYVLELLERVSQSNEKEEETKDNKSQDKKDNKTEKQDAIDAKTAKSPKRKYMANLGLNVKHEKLGAIYQELVQLFLSKYPNSAAVLFRVFLEGSINYFIKRKQIQIEKKNDQEKSLNQKLFAVIEWVEKEQSLNRNQTKPIRVAVADKDSISSIDTFHAYIHTPEFQPTPDYLRRAWDDYEPLLRVIWE